MFFLAIVSHLDAALPRDESRQVNPFQPLMEVFFWALIPLERRLLTSVAPLPCARGRSLLLVCSKKSSALRKAPLFSATGGETYLEDIESRVFMVGLPSSECSVLTGLQMYKPGKFRVHVFPSDTAYQPP